MKIDAEAIRAAQRALAADGEYNDDLWPKTRNGYPKLAVSNSMADRLIALGAATEDDLFRLDDLPLGTKD